MQEGMEFWCVGGENANSGSPKATRLCVRILFFNKRLQKRTEHVIIVQQFREIARVVDGMLVRAMRVVSPLVAIVVVLMAEAVERGMACVGHHMGRRVSGSWAEANVRGGRHGGPVVEAGGGSHAHLVEGGAGCGGREGEWRVDAHHGGLILGHWGQGKRRGSGSGRGGELGEGWPVEVNWAGRHILAPLREVLGELVQRGERGRDLVQVWGGGGGADVH